MDKMTGDMICCKLKDSEPQPHNVPQWRYFCNENEVKTDKSACPDPESITKAIEQEKAAACPAGTLPLNMQSTNNINAFFVKVNAKCGDRDKVDWNKTDKKLRFLKSSNEYFGCYACRDTNIPTKPLPYCKSAYKCERNTPVEYDPATGLCGFSMSPGKKCCCDPIT